MSEPSDTVRIIHGAKAARAGILRRAPLEEAAPPEYVRARDRALFGPGLSVGQVVERIIAAVRTEGDAAVVRFNERLDGAAPLPVRVGREEFEEAYRQVPAELVDALQQAADRIRAYHQRQLQAGVQDFEERGLGQLVRAIERAGIYVPGTTAPLPSSLLMAAIPARVAGVDEVYVASPALADGSIPAVKLVAADIAEVTTVFRMGGAQAIAAFAYGTETVPRVDKVCGPGGLFTTLAKRQVFGVTGIDAIYGPTETVVIADESADPVLAAADLLAQAEHDELASPILLTDSPALAERVAAEVRAQLGELERGRIAAAAFAGQGGIVVTESLEEAIALANEYAPEHLCLLVRDPWEWLPKVRNAGGVFLGEASPEALGDYIAGPSHAMPTGGSARYASPLSVNDFRKVISLVAVLDATTRELGEAAARIARAEGLTAHARALERRLESR
ncbi:MAG: histidinol dehydrogenase [Dehalococcoidia bacterium]